MKKHFNNLKNVVLFKDAKRKIFSVHLIESEQSRVNKNKEDPKFPCEMATPSAVEELIKNGWKKVDYEDMFGEKIIKKYADID
jgi:hypothetical protein